MTETKVEYVVTETPPPPTPPELITCPVCGHLLGILYKNPATQKLYLLNGNFAIENAFGGCNNCGAPFRWCSNDKTLQKIVEQHRKVY